MRKRLDLENATSMYTLPLVSGTNGAPLLALQESIEYAAQILPAEGPVSAFVFLNALHALEHLPFDEAVKEGAKRFGCQPYLSEERYRAKIARGRIRAIDVQAVLEDDLKQRGWESVAGLCSRLNLRSSMLRHAVEDVADEELRWCMAQARSMTSFGKDTPENIRKDILADVLRWVVRDLVNGNEHGGYVRPEGDDPRRKHILWKLLDQFGDADIDSWSDETWEKFSVQALWSVCKAGVVGLPRPPFRATIGTRPRNLLMDATEVDSDVLVNDVLIRFAAAFIDQGFASAVLPFKQHGFFKAFCKIYRQRIGPPAAWMRGLDRELARLDDENVSSLDCIHESVKLLGISPEEWDEFFLATMLALRGWASMIRQMEVRPDRVPNPSPVGTLTDFLAVRLLLERHALAHVAEEHLDYTGPLCDLREAARARVTKSKLPSVGQRTYMIFQLAQLLGWNPSSLHGMSPSQWAQLVGEIEAFNSVERRRILHQAFERRFRERALDAFSIHTAKIPTPVKEPRFQAVFCIDAREESFRRHIEEICPQAETFAAPGFFGVAMYYKGAAEAHYSPLCPILVRPMHWVTEEVVYSLKETNRHRRSARKAIGTALHTFHRGSLGFASGIVTAGLGVLATFPLAARVLFPRLTAEFTRSASEFLAPPAVTRLVIERIAAEPGPNGDSVGFTVDEMAERSERLLSDIGMTKDFSRIVFFLGHASRCLNNPHKSAYDCGACCGPGGPNARALAMMLNDRRVRAILANRGLKIPDDTVFVGGVHNTATETITCFDLDVLPKSHLKDYIAAREVFEQTCERNAHERCRRFDSAPLNVTPAGAHRHVKGRAEDLAQVRPEFGNATNAMCFVGRRDRVRGLFLDRRCFQHSYDPMQDDANVTKLGRVLSAVVPVCQGINLMYFFSAIDNNTWGASTKLPHNVTSLLGVMDGAASDLRQGLPWQCVEIHEPMRLLFIVESTPEAMKVIMERDKIVGRILKNNWARLAVLSPDSNELREFKDGEFHLYHREASVLPRAETSIDWYRGWRDHLDFATIVQ